MKTKKVLKRIAKIEALISKVTDRSSASPSNIRVLLRHAKAAVIRAKEAVQASFGTPHTPAKNPSKTRPEYSKPKRKLPAAGTKAISAATTKSRAGKKATVAKRKPAITKKPTAKKAAAKKVAAKNVPGKKAAAVEAAAVKATKQTSRRMAKKFTAKKATAPATNTVRVVQAATTPAHPPIEAAAVNTPEQTAPEAPVHEAGEAEASE